MWLPKKSPVWSSNGFEWSGCEYISSLSVTSTTSEISLLKSLGRIGQVKLSLFLRRLGVGRVAFSCTCQWTFYAVKSGCVLGELGVAWFPSFTVFRVPEGSLFQCEAWPLGQFEHFVPSRNEGFPSFCFVCLFCFVYCSEGRKEGVHHLLKKFLRLRSF